MNRKHRRRERLADSLKPDTRRRRTGTLSSMRPGQSAEVVALEAPDRAGCRRLFALGLVPGARLTLIQRFPTYVFTVGRTTIAVDGEMARGIRVAPSGRRPR